MRMSKPTPDSDLPVSRLDRILAFMALGLLALSVLSFLSIMISTAMGLTHEDYGTGIWPAVSAIVYIAPPLAFVLMLTVIIRAFIRRARANRAG